jgi:hypothetical protein
MRESVGEYSRDMDMACPASILASCITASSGAYRHSSEQDQRDSMDTFTGLEWLNRLHMPVDKAAETVKKHFLFWCTRWEIQRRQMLEQTETRRGNLSFYLGKHYLILRIDTHISFLPSPPINPITHPCMPRRSRFHCRR